MPREPEFCQKTRARGAAMIEAVVAIPVFVVIFAGTVFINQVFSVKHKVSRDAAQAAWSNAVHSCESGSWTKDSESAISALGAYDTLGGISNGSSSLQQYGNDNAQGVYGREFGTAVGSVQRTVVSNTIFGSRSLEFSSTARVMCNEITRGGYPEDAAIYAFKNLTRW